ncbi:MULTISPECIES: cytochrome bc1 complex cytochrome b subunit [unclassified Streptomyces]|uniref:cytochrome bc1 complex cytochrome b subunit n=1 Tax=unclassified Streptomyces TaxID=2593676 RepID=UPI002E0D787A|nr:MULTISPECIES: ubiquinol-cytochrome c reductase cytochrome b subunit [unclassified Streptomyces]WSR22866.1 ubiquinol-cytochrome c reductase cytochrome b subunit [Streptomyces sp. NBC_01205]
MVLKRKKARAVRLARRSARRTVRGLDDRLPLLEAAKAGLRKAFPDHWAFLLGEIALYSLVVLLLTGTYLTFFFEPSMREVTYEGSYGPLSGLRVSSAYASTLRISFDVRGGLLIRQMHHWAALVFVAAIGVHMLRVFLTGAFRKPREANWLVGVTMLLLALVEGFAGYSLPDDLLSGTGLRTAQGIMLSLPVVGTYASLLVFGGEFPGQDIVPRLYPVHILLVPGLLVALVSLHLMLVVHLKHTQWAVPGSSGRNVLGKPFFPQYMAKSAGLLFMVGGLFGVLGALAQINPVWAYGPYRPDVVSIGSQPDWYVGFLEGALRLMPGFETRLWGHTLMWNPLVAGIVLPGLLFAGLYAYPFFERWITPGGGEQHLCDRPRHRPARTALGVAVLAGYAVLLLAGAQDVIAFVFEVPLPALTWALRCALVVGPPASFWLTRRICLALQHQDAEELESGQPTDEVRQSVEGGYHPAHRPVARSERYVRTVHSLPAPVRVPPPARGWTDRLRRGLSRWYYRDQPQSPLDGAQRRRVAAVLAGPDAAGAGDAGDAGERSSTGY